MLKVSSPSTYFDDFIVTFVLLHQKLKATIVLYLCKEKCLKEGEIYCARDVTVYCCEDLKCLDRAPGSYLPHICVKNGSENIHYNLINKSFYFGFNNVPYDGKSILSCVLDSNGLLTGKLISQGSMRNEVLGEATRSLGVKSNQVEEVKVRSLHIMNYKSVL